MTDAPILLTPNETGELLRVARATLYRLHSAGRVPLPVRIGRSVFWRRKELLAWIGAGCPPRARWEWKESI